MDTMKIDREAFEALVVMVNDLHIQNRDRVLIKETIDLLEAAIALNVSESTIYQMFNREAKTPDEFESKFATNSLLKRRVKCNVTLINEDSGVVASQYKWTGTKSEIVELVEAILLVGSINDGKVVKKELYEFIGNIFSVDLSNHNNILDHIYNRKDTIGTTEGRVRYISNLLNAITVKLKSRDYK